MWLTKSALPPQQEKYFKKVCRTFGKQLLCWKRATPEKVKKQENWQLWCLSIPSSIHAFINSLHQGGLFTCLFVCKQNYTTTEQISMTFSPELAPGLMNLFDFGGDTDQDADLDPNLWDQNTYLESDHFLIQRKEERKKHQCVAEERQIQYDFFFVSGNDKVITWRIWDLNLSLQKIWFSW